VITPSNPLKDSTGLLPEKERVEMLKLAISGHKGFRICLREFSLPKPSYTHITLDILKQENPGKKFALIIGSDNLEIFDQWKEYEQILSNTEILVYPRSATINEGKLMSNYNNVKLVNAPIIGISSTYIREAINSGFDPKYMLPEKVLRLIRQKYWYKT